MDVTKRVRFLVGLVVPVVLSMMLGSVAAVAAPQEEIVGDWHGTLDVPGGSLPVVFHISETDGSLTATLDSPSQGATGIPVDSVVFDNGHVSLRIAAIGGGYEGELGVCAAETVRQL